MENIEIEKGLNKENTILEASDRNMQIAKKKHRQQGKTERDINNNLTNLRIVKKKKKK